MKDMNSKTDMYRANAIRVLCRIIDGTLLTQIERYLKQAIVDKNPVVASAALVSGIHILQVLLNSFCWRSLVPSLCQNLPPYICLMFTVEPRDCKKVEQWDSGSCAIKTSPCTVSRTCLTPSGWSKCFLSRWLDLPFKSNFFEKLQSYISVLFQLHGYSHFHWWF